MQFVEGRDQVSTWIQLTSDLCLRLFWLGTYRIMSKEAIWNQNSFSTLVNDFIYEPNRFEYETWY